MKFHARREINGANRQNEFLPASEKGSVEVMQNKGGRKV